MRAVKASSLFAVLTLLAASLVQLSCQSTTTPSVLVIAVDDLTVTDILCNEETEKSVRSGFEILCQESVRFTHAFTPSTMSVPALTSLLTGLYPYQNKVRNNGLPELQPPLVSVAERALQRHYRTAFYSGGPPVWRKSGLNQGFEVFDDSLVPTRQGLYRPLASTSKLFLQWMHQDVGSSNPFFSVIYTPDLLFTNTVTVNDQGETRNLSHESQLDELDEDLYNLFKELKTQQRWNNTMVIVVGLNGLSNDDRPGELSPSNLHSENTQVALFVKPPRKPRDEALQWKIDRNVTLPDLGATLFDFLGISENPNKPFNTFPVHSLSGVFRKNQLDWSEDRLILLESDWSAWRGLSNRRTAVLDGHFLYMHDTPGHFYNTLVDRLETNPLRPTELPVAERQRIFESLAEINADPWQGLSKDLLEKFSPDFSRWIRPDQKPSLLKDLKPKVTGKYFVPEINNWVATLAFELKDWDTLKITAQNANNPFWQYVADKNKTPPVPNNFNFLSDNCLRLLEIPKVDSADLKKCDNGLFLDFVDWQRAPQRNLSKEIQKRRFERAFLTSQVDQNIYEGYLASNLVWDLPKKATLSPSLTEMLLSLPEYQKQKTSVMHALQNESISDEE